MTSQQKTAWKRKEPTRFPLNPDKWTCPDCGVELQWKSRVVHQTTYCKKHN